jgi:hypothetical protein
VRDVRHSPLMPDTGERREITRFVNAKEAETVQESKRLISTTKQRSAKTAQESRSRKRRTVCSSSEEKPRESEGHRSDREASERMVDEGGIAQPDPTSTSRNYSPANLGSVHPTTSEIQNSKKGAPL